MKNQKTYRSKRVLVRAGVSYETFGLSYAVNVVLVCSGMVASIKLCGTWKRIGTGDEREDRQSKRFHILEVGNGKRWDLRCYS